MNNGKVRNSSFELMRILSMISIIWIHMLGWPGIHNKVSEPIGFFINFILALTVVHVNSFILLSGYYQSKSKFKFSKILRLFGTIWFYNTICRVIAMVFGWFPYEGISKLLWDIFPFNFKSYWFLTMYIALYLFTPFLNKMISNLDKKTFLKLLFTFYLVISILIRISLGSFIENQGGYSIINFIFIYMLGAYFQKYKIKFKNPIIEKNKKYIFVAIFLFAFLFRYMLGFLGHYMETVNHNSFQIIGKHLAYGFGKNIYDDPFVILQSAAYFLFFESLHIHSKIINFISKGTIEAYLIHSNNYLRKFEFDLFHLTNASYSGFVIVYVLFIAILIYMFSMIVYHGRQCFIMVIKALGKKVSWIEKTEIKRKERIQKIDHFYNLE